MVKRFHSLALISLCGLSMCTTADAQVSFSSSRVLFDTVSAQTVDTAAFFIRNNGSTPLSVTNISPFRPVFSVLDASGGIPPGDSMRVRIQFQTNQNVTWQDVLLVEANDNRTYPLIVQGTGIFGDSYDVSTLNLWEINLKTALHGLVTPHIDLGYNIARDRMFESIDDPSGIDTIECVYTGRRVRAANRTEAQNQNFNTEHTWPQGTFGSSDPMRSDIYHLFPTDEVANSARSNFPFGPVVSNITWQVGGSKLGFNPNGLTAFEPRDIHKGDVARAIFYFMLRYENNYAGYLDQLQEIYLRQWYNTDAVSQKEILRNSAIASFQGKRNPLVDHPEFIERISSFRSLSPPVLQPDIRLAPLAIDFGTVAVDDSTEWVLTIINSGRSALTLTGISLDAPSEGFRIVEMPAIVPVDTFAQIRLRFVPSIPNQTFSTNLRITSNDPDEQVVMVPLIGVSMVTGLATISSPLHSVALFQNFPNPFNPSTTIQFSVDREGKVSLEVFNILGRQIASLVNDNLSPGIYTRLWDASGFPSGTYFYRLSSQSGTHVRRLILIR